MKVSGTHVQEVYEKIEVLHYFRFAAEMLPFLLLISISHALGKLWYKFYSSNKLF